MTNTKYQAQSTGDHASASQPRQRGRPRTFDRQHALCQALRVFWEKSYDAATMQDLCTAMGISSPSLYCAFGNKKDLFMEALHFYREHYWQPVFTIFLREPDLHKAWEELLQATPRILLAPDAPCGCLTVLTAMRKPVHEEDITKAVAAMRAETRHIFRQRLKAAIKDGQLAPDSDLGAISGAMANFFEGLTLQALDDICQRELLAIARRGTALLPPPIGAPGAS